MTCIAAICVNNTVYMGGDSASTNETSMTLRADQKVFILKKKFLIGFTTSFRMGQLLHFSLNVPSQKKSQDDFQFMCTTFINAVKKCFKKGDFGKTEEGGEFLVGYKGNIYKIQEDFQVEKSLDNYSAVGTGEEYALGSFFSTDAPDIKSEDRVLCALKAAAKFSTSVREPLYIYALAYK